MIEWTEERVNALRTMWQEEGLSASQIARVLGGLTRSAVLGKVHRLGLAKRITPDLKIKRAALAAKRRRGPSQPGTLRKRQLAELRQQLSAHPEPVALHVPLADLEWGMCRAVSLTDNWGEPKYCGQPCGENESWCAAHQARVFQPAEPKKRERSRIDTRQWGWIR